MVRTSVVCAQIFCETPNDIFLRCCLLYSIDITSSGFTATFGISGLRSVGTTMKRAANIGIAPSSMIIGLTKFFHSNSSKIWACN